ncbi:MAG: EAL domain-containing protein [Nitrococcus sp.]|nr:EAL domain-containing protein [Nitrococcus sp.]
MEDCDSEPDWPSRRADPEGPKASTGQLGPDSGNHLQCIIDAIPTPIFFKGTNLRYIGCNRAFADLILGDTPESIIGKSVYDVSIAELAAAYDAADQELLKDGGTQRYEAQVGFNDGSVHDIEFHKAVIYDAAGNKLGLVGTMLDITERRRREVEAERLASYDDLTGLPNRRLLQERAETALRQSIETRRPLGVLYLDLDRFKDINDTQGHSVGDQLLVQVASRLRQSLRERDLLARIGGDEFAVLAPDTSRAELARTARHLMQHFESPFHIDGRAIRLGASMGLVTCPDEGANLGELLKHADIAMYRAKAEGRGFMLFETVHGDEIRERVDLERDLAHAIDVGDITLVFQPWVHARRGRVDGLEALARWHHPVRGVVPPELFIPLAEATGLIHRLGQQVLTMICRQIAAWRTRGLAMRVAINISARELQHPRFVDNFLDTLVHHGLTGEALEAELTETVLMTSPEDSVRALQRLRTAGTLISVDDFGTGYSSLTHLKRLPVDTLKVDRGFVAEMTTDPVDTGIVETIVALARSLHVNVIAEGVETEAQHQALLELGCEVQQGYWFCRPLPVEGIEAWLRR